MTNEAFNAAVPNITAYGDQSEVDILSGNCDFDLAASGNYFAALYNNDFSDEIAFHLSQPIEENRLYYFRFSAQLGTQNAHQSSKIEIGLSNDPELFGETLFSVENLGLTWQTYDFQFYAPSDANYITVRVLSDEETWIFIDDFSLYCPEFDLGNDTSYCFVENIPLSVPDLFESYQWSNQSNDTSILVNEPGIYSIEAIVNTCVVTDQIQIDEILFNCECQVFVPNIFSPNGDGFNDLLFPVSPCAVFDYEINIFNRWGVLIFKSQNLEDGWDGTFNSEPLQNGTYTYLVKHRFEYQENQQIQKGSFVLLR